MKLSIPFLTLIIALAVGCKSALGLDKQASIIAKLVDRCCLVGKERAIENPKFTCKMGAREALVNEHQGRRNLLAQTAESMLTNNPNFADQCEMVLESCCLAYHRSKNCDSGKQFAKSGAACMDVELSKESTLATESFNDCCMSCSLGILAAKNPSQNETSSPRSNLSDRCKLMSPLASSLSGQLYEQTYNECCQENLPRTSSALLQPGASIDCAQYNPCSQRCISGGNLNTFRGKQYDEDRCECFAGYRLADDKVTCLDIDECKLGTHTCNRVSEVCDNTRGSFKCLARQSSFQDPANRPLDGLASEAVNDNGEVNSGFLLTRICPNGSRWDSIEGKCKQLDGVQKHNPSQSSLASLSSWSTSRLLNSQSSWIGSQPSSIAA